ncbi:MAG: hypothetical protein ACM359_05825 [Bacillota bacterium]
MIRGIHTTIVYCIIVSSISVLQAAENRVRNGSFEGSLAYWLDIEKCTLLRRDAADGEHYLHIEKDGPRSTPFALPLGRPVRISLWIRSDQNSELRMWIAPSHREIAQEIKAAWNGQMFTAKATGQWQHVSFDYTAQTRPRPPWWPDSVYILAIGASGSLCIDGVSIAEIGDGVVQPRRAVEVTSDITNLPGYKANGNLLDRSFVAQVRATAFNTTRQPQSLTLRWQLMDYEGRRVLSDAIDRRVTILPDQSAIETVPIPLSAVGLMLARVSAIDEHGQVIDQSDAPVTVLPFPKRATLPDPRERFGVSLTGPLSAKLSQKLGFRWCRWWWDVPMSWSSVEKTPGTYDWPDEVVDLLTLRGYSIDYVMYDPPPWAQAKDNLPADMQWPANDPRWDDLSIHTNWDRFVSILVKRYARKPIVWEFQNEPDLLKWDPALYTAMVKRTARRVKQANPNAMFLVNCVWPAPTSLQERFFELGGAKFIDCYTYHNYTPGEAASPATIAALRQRFASSNPTAKLWFNEGWSFVNSSHDDAALALTRLTGAEASHILVRNMADLLAAGQEKFIGFQYANAQGGRSWWDWYGPGTQLWDDRGDPTAAAVAWNVLIDQLGLSTYVATLRPQGTTLHLFQDDRNKRGVIVAYASHGDVELVLPIEGMILRNVMGQDTPLKAVSGKTTVRLPADQRPFFLFSQSGASAQELRKMLATLPNQNQHAGFGAYRRSGICTRFHFGRAIQHRERMRDRIQEAVTIHPAGSEYRCICCPLAIVFAVPSASFCCAPRGSIRPCPMPPASGCRMGPPWKA